MDTQKPASVQRLESSDASDVMQNHAEPMFRMMFERSADAILLFDPLREVFVDCNHAAVNLMRATSKEQLLLTHPADVSPEYQPDGRKSLEKTHEMVAATIAGGSHRFEWLSRRFDGTEFHVEVLGTVVRTGPNPLVANVCRDITYRKAAEDALRESEARFRSLFERSTDAMSLYDPKTGHFIQANDAVLRQTGAPSRDALGKVTPAEISPLRQPDGRLSSDKAQEMVELALVRGSHRFEWISCGFDGRELPLDVVMTAIPSGDRALLFVVTRDISSHKQSETEILRLNASLEKSVDERNAELVRTNEQLRRTEQDLRNRGSMVQKHRDVLLELARAPKSEFNRALEIICSRAANTLEVARVSYWSLRENGSAIVCESLYLRDIGQTDEKFKGAEVRASDCPSYFEALGARCPIVANNVLICPATSGLAEGYLRPLGISSMLDAPVWVRGEVVGVLCHEHTGEGRVWTAEEIDFASALATMVSLALEESQRSRSEHLLRESEEKFRALFEASSQGVILHDEEKMLEANPACLRLLGYERAEDIIGKHPAAVSAPIQPNGQSADILARKHIQDCMTHGSTRFEWMAMNTRNGEVPIEVILTRIQWGGRQILQAVFNDITARKQAETELQESESRLKESEARFSAAFHSSPVFITIATLNGGKFILANEAFLKWTEYRLDEILGRDSQELSLWADPAERLPFWDELQRTRSIRERECRMRNRHGKVFIVLLSADIIEINRVPHLLIVGLDISQRKQAEAELLESAVRLRESEARFSTAFHASPVLITISRVRDAKFVEANEAFLRCMGFSREEICGHDSAELGIWVDKNARSHFLAELRRSGSVREVECMLRSRNGKLHTMLLSADLIDSGGEPHVIVFGLVITERKKAEAEMLRTLAREKELGQLRSNFVSMVSHEFRTPLGIIQSSAEILEDYLDKLRPAERKEQLRSITKNTRRMASLMEEVLLIGSLDAGRMEFKPASLDLCCFARRLVDEVISATEQRCPIELSLEKLPAEVHADERILRHIFINLLTNAVKYSDPGKTVRFQLHCAGTDVVCGIYDQGIGIPETDREWLFYAFHRGGNVGNRQGTGLGLVIVKRCVDLHGGSIRVESEIGVGTSMTVKLPLLRTGHAQHQFASI